MSLENYLKRQIAQQGPITVAEFMQLALMHPRYGYYQQQQVFGKEGDFTTAPEISQLFGEMVGVWVASIWQQLGCPKDIALIELGPGRGVLMQDVLRATRHVKGFHDALEIIMIEQSVALTQTQQEALASFSMPKQWYPTLEKLPSKPSLFIANEFFDALPIHQYVQTQEGLRERLIGVEEDELIFMLSALPADIFVQRMAKQSLERDQIIEYSPACEHVMTQIAEHIKRYGGAGLFIDYGYEMPAYGDTLQAVKSHRYHPVLEDVGEADITAHVNFTALAHAAIQTGITQQHIITQSAFLNQMGIEVRAKHLKEKANATQREQLDAALHRLLSQDEMGKLFKVLMIG